MNLINLDIESHYLYPSSLFTSKDSCLVDTVLGSCVSVCLFDTKLKIGGINHYMLPFWNGEGLASPKYGNVATTKLIEKMIQMGSSKQTMVAKVFGGANQIQGTSSVGERNILIAKEVLKEHKIPVVAESVGGGIGRKVKFNTSTGEVLMKFLKGKK